MKALAEPRAFLHSSTSTRTPPLPSSGWILTEYGHIKIDRQLNAHSSDKHCPISSFPLHNYNQINQPSLTHAGNLHTFTSNSVFAYNSSIPRISGRRRSVQLLRLQLHTKASQPIVDQARVKITPPQTLIRRDCGPHGQFYKPKLSQTTPTFDGSIVANDKFARHRHSEPEEKIIMSPEQVQQLIQQIADYNAFMRAVRSSENSATSGLTSSVTELPVPMGSLNADQEGSFHAQLNLGAIGHAKSNLNECHERAGQAAYHGREHDAQPESPSTSTTPMHATRVSTTGPRSAFGFGNHFRGPIVKRRRNPTLVGTEMENIPKTQPYRNEDGPVDSDDVQTPLERARAVLTEGLSGKRKRNCDPTQPIQCQLAAIPGCVPGQSGLCEYWCADSAELVAHILAAKNPPAGQTPGHGIAGSKGSKTAAAGRHAGYVGICTWGSVMGCTLLGAQKDPYGMGEGNGVDTMVAGNIARHIATVHANLTRAQDAAIRKALKQARSDDDTFPASTHRGNTPIVGANTRGGDGKSIDHTHFGGGLTANCAFNTDDLDTNIGVNSFYNPGIDAITQGQNTMPSNSIPSNHVDSDHFQTLVPAQNDVNYSDICSQLHSHIDLTATTDFVDSSTPNFNHGNVDYDFHDFFDLDAATTICPSIETFQTALTAPVASYSLPESKLTDQDGFGPAPHAAWAMPHDDANLEQYQNEAEAEKKSQIQELEDEDDFWGGLEYVD